MILPEEDTLLVLSELIQSSLNLSHATVENHVDVASRFYHNRYHSFCNLVNPKAYVSFSDVVEEDFGLTI